jgi:hypothetical protein
MDRVAECILRAAEAGENETRLAEVREHVVSLCREFPLFPHRLKKK